MNRSSPRHAHGFTLIEAMVTLSILGLLLALSAPSLQQVVAKQRLRSASYDLVTDLTLARSESLKRGAAVKLSPANPGGWAGGWTVTVATTVLSQRNKLGVTVPTAPAEVEFNAQGMVANVTDTVKFGFGDGNGNSRCILLDPTGRPKALATACTP